jgi:hypothetical protein
MFTFDGARGANKEPNLKTNRESRTEKGELT